MLGPNSGRKLLFFKRQNLSLFREQIASQRFEANIIITHNHVFDISLSVNKKLYPGCWSLPEYVGNGYSAENKIYSKK